MRFSLSECSCFSLRTHVVFPTTHRMWERLLGIDQMESLFPDSWQTYIPQVSPRGDGKVKESGTWDMKKRMLVRCHLIRSWEYGSGRQEGVNKKWQKQRGNATVRTQCVGDCSLGRPLGSHWASWRCPPWPSTGCAGWGLTWRELPSGRGSAARTAPLLPTAVPQWPCGGSGRLPRASTQTPHTGLSTRPGDLLPLHPQTHSPPKYDERTRNKF